MSEPKSYGTALLLSATLGAFGADKFYVGANQLGFIQLALSLSLIGLFISIPWSNISTITLALAILFGSATFLYPDVNWAPVTDTDMAVGIIVGVSMVSMVLVNLVKMTDQSESKCIEISAQSLYM